MNPVFPWYIPKRQIDFCEESTYTTCAYLPAHQGYCFWPNSRKNTVQKWGCLKNACVGAVKKRISIQTSCEGLSHQLYKLKFIFQKPSFNTVGDGFSVPVILEQNHIAIGQLILFSYGKSPNALHFGGDGKPVPYDRITNLYSLNSDLSMCIQNGTRLPNW